MDVKDLILSIPLNPVTGRPANARLRELKRMLENYSFEESNLRFIEAEIRQAIKLHQENAERRRKLFSHF